MDELPIGLTESRKPAYRLKKRQDKALFGYNVGPNSWKKYLFPPNAKLWQAKKAKDGFEIEPDNEETPRYAFIGVRACELHAIQIQDKVFMGEHANNPRYESRRNNSFIVAVNCGQAAKTCFCTSMNTGPKVGEGYDLALTEILDGPNHYFVAESGSDEGAAVLAKIQHRDAGDKDLKAAAACTAKAEKEMGRTLDTNGIKELLYRNLDNPRWDDVASRCLTCANCTMVCPTCFCSTVTDTTDLTGDHAERWQSWDSCFTMDFSYIHGGEIRSSTKSRTASG